MDKKMFSFRMADGNVVKMEAHDCLPSTAALAKEYAAAGYPDRYVVFADRQTTAPITNSKLKEGQSEEGVFMSCILRPSLFASQSSFLGPMAAVALVTALSEHTTAKLGIGWVSDIYCEGERIGGAMLEGKLDSYSAFEYLIVTFAIKLTSETFPPRITDMIRKIFESENASLPMIIGRTVLTKFFTLYPTVKTPQKFMDAYAKHFALRGVPVKLLKDGKQVRARILSVDIKDGALMVENKKHEVFRINTGGKVILPRKIPLSKEENKKKK